ncbi:MAG: GNAT family N-acetyltransferase [Marinomonas sp.]|jgi:ribosomal protein S18 acetylase RimI-like enzyme|uniref:GNAT family N-acetyltransferase n=1 Tax=unclassified Marinomonas TaxID=196814 RepID=UPI0007AF01A1|nr:MULTISPECIES: GNAT family N-acetyltransferase [unclassified Marinomonas]KZM38767.1 hypothetical protein OA91_23435 [Marinomonas sp. SBI8L]KZM43769.1 hypothetical protein OA92_08865 [Marinomonas sp. SBI22]
MEIKEYDAKYQAQLEHIYLTARQDTFQWMDTSHYKLSDFIEDTKGEKIWLAEDSSGVLGFIAVWSQDQFIHHLYVDKRAQRKGVGKALIDTVSQFYQQAIRLKCLCNNQNAIQFYQSQGFKELSKGVDKEGDYLFLQRG